MQPHSLGQLSREEHARCCFLLAANGHLQKKSWQALCSGKPCHQMWRPSPLSALVCSGMRGSTSAGVVQLRGSCGAGEGKLGSLTCSAGCDCAVQTGSASASRSTEQPRDTSPRRMASLAYSTARLSRVHTAAPGAVKQQQAPGQLLELEVDGGGGGASGGRAHASTLLYIPCTYKPGVPAPLILTLHGAGGDAHGGRRWAGVGDKACTGMLGGGQLPAGARVSGHSA